MSNCVNNSIINARNTLIVSGLLVFGLSSCEKQCKDVSCPADQDLKIVLIDSNDNNLIAVDYNSFLELRLLAPARKDTLLGHVDKDRGAYSVETHRDLAKYTLVIGESTNVDIMVYQQYVPSEFECCPGFWRIDSVYARGEKLNAAANEEGFLFVVDK
jgi:hypothetical protein